MSNDPALEKLAERLGEIQELARQGDDKLEIILKRINRVQETVEKLVAKKNGQ